MKTSLLSRFLRRGSARGGILSGTLACMLMAGIAGAADTVTVSAVGQTGSRVSNGALTSNVQVSYTPVVSARTTLNGAITTTSATSITVTSATGIAVGDILTIGSEKLQVTDITGAPTLVVTRGYAGSTAATASNGATVSISVFGQLNGALADGVVTTVVLDDTTGLAVGDTIEVNSEKMYVSAVNVNGTTLTVTRGYVGSTAAAQADNSPVKLLTPGKATFDVVFSEAVYPVSLDVSGGLINTTLLSAVFDGFVVQKTSDPGTNSTWVTASWKAEQMDGKTFRVYASGVYAGGLARLTVDSSKFAKSSSGTAYAGSLATPRSVEFIERTILDGINVVQADYFGFLNTPTVIGSFDTGVLDASVTVTGTGITGSTKVDCIGASADWTFAPVDTIPIGYKDYTFAGKDAAGNAAGGAASVSKTYYVWNQPTITFINPQSSTVAGRTTPVSSSGNISFNTAKPALTGAVGLPYDLKTGTAHPQVKVDIFDHGTSNPVVTQMTAEIITGGGGNTATWSLDSGEAGTNTDEWGSNALTLTPGALYDIVLTMRVVDSNAGAQNSVNSVQVTRTLAVLAPAAAPTLALNGYTSPTTEHKPTLSITGTATTDQIKIYDALNSNTQVPGAISGSGPFIFTPTSAFDVNASDHNYSFYAVWTDGAGNPSASSNAVALTIHTPVPTVAVIPSSPTTKHYPTLTITADVDGSGSQDTILTGSGHGSTAITVEVNDGSGWTTKSGSLSTTTWTPSTQWADGVYSIRAKFTDFYGKIGATSTPVSLTITTPTPQLATLGSSSAAADGNFQYLSSTLLPTIKVTDAVDGVTALANGSLTMYKVAGKTDVVADIKAGGTVTGGLVGTTWTPIIPLTSEGVYSYVAEWVDNKAANGTDVSHVTSVVSNVFHLRVISSADLPVVTAFHKIAGEGGGALTRTNNVVNTSSQNIVVSGTCNAGAIVRVYRNGVTLPPKNIAVTNTPTTTTWSYEFSDTGESSALSNGSNLLTFAQTDLQGTTSAQTSPAVNIYVDSLTPNAPTISSPVTGTTMATLRPTFTGTAAVNTTITLYDGATPLTPTASTAANGSWTLSLDADLTVATHTITAKATSASGLVSDPSTAVSLIITAPALTVTLAPLAKSDALGYKVDDDAGVTLTSTNAYNIGATLIKVKAPTSGTFLVGDSVTIASNTYSVTAVAGTSSVTSSITISPGLKAAILKDTGADTVGITVNAQPAGPASGGTTPSSLTTVLLTATMTEPDDTHGTDAGTAVDPVANITSTEFTAAKVHAVHGKVNSVTKGTGAVGAQPTNVWTISVAPDASGTLSVDIPMGVFKTAAGKYLTSFTQVAAGSHYTSTPTVTITGAGGTAATATATVGSKAITGLTLTNKGWGYTAAPTVTITPVGSGAKATATVSGGVTGFTGLVGGSGYAAAPDVIFTTGSGATATATVSGGHVTAITKTAGGVDYVAAPTVVITPTGGDTPGTPAAATAIISGGVVTGITVTTQGTGYAHVPTISFTAIGSGTAAATAHLTNGVVTSITVDTAGTGYTTAPKVYISSGQSASFTANVADYTVEFNSASSAYTLPMNRTKPTVTWQYAADGLTGYLLPQAAAATAISGTQYYANIGNNSGNTDVTVRAHFSAPMARALQASDLTVTGCAVQGAITTINSQNYDVTLRRTGTATTMTATVKAVADLLDTTVPAQSNIASLAFTVQLITPSSAGPVIASAVGAAAPQKGAKTPTYPCTVTWPTPVTGFTADKLTVVNGVITGFAGSGKVYSFTLTPGEGLVSVQYDSGANPVYDVTGNLIADSNVFSRLMDSTQPSVVTVSSPFFNQMGSGATGTATIKTGAAATAHVTGGVVDSITVGTPSSGYLVAPTVTLVGGGATTAATATASINGSGAVSVTLVDGGAGYTSAPTVVFGSQVLTVAVGAGGTGYKVVPTISLVTQSGHTGSGATATATIDADGAISGITVTAPGNGYDVAPTVVVNNSLRPTYNGSTVVRFPVRVTFNESLPAFPVAALVASVNGKALTLKPPYDLLVLDSRLVGPQVVPSTGNRTYEFDLEVPAASAGALRLVVPSQGVTDGALNAGQASGVYGVTYDLTNGAPIEVKASNSPVFSNG